MRDLNFVLRLEIFVHLDGQLRASHLILGIDLVYTTWQILVDSSLLSYIDVWHTNLLPPSLTVGEAKYLDPRYTTVDSLARVRDASANLVSQSRKVHVLVVEDSFFSPYGITSLATHTTSTYY